MGATDTLLLLLTHPNEFRKLALFWLYHVPKRDITSVGEHGTSGWDRQSMRKCWEFLDLTSRSFSAVVKELDGDLARVICLFYLVLRGLDTVEDDMTIPHSVKQPLLRSFHEKILTPGWNFSGSGPRERDRQLLVEFDVVVPELLLLPAHYRSVIVDICHKMEVGMADYAAHAHDQGAIGLDTVEDLDLYCHYVAGVVGEGLSRIFAASGKEREWIGEQLVLSNSMGLMLQKTNILRDYREDVNQGRLFWPREIWGTLGGNGMGFVDPKDMYKPENEKRALWALSAMTLDALRHAIHCLDYMALLRNQTVFNFSAIPQTMAMATLALCFMNPLVFQRNIKIRKAEAAEIIMRSTNPREVANIFRHYARIIHSKAVPADPNFLPLSVACGKIEQWCEHHYPSFISLGAGGKPQIDLNDLRGKVQSREQEKAKEVVQRKRVEEIMRRTGAANGTANGMVPSTGGAVEDMTVRQVLLYSSGVVALLVIMGLLIVYVLVQFS